MYMMIGLDLKNFPNISSCLEFTRKLTSEQSIMIFPGIPCLEFPGFLRMVLTVPEDMIVVACARIKEFCDTHYMKN